MELIAYKNDPKLKKLMVAEVRRHEKLDMILKGTYGKENGTWKGCAVGCSIHSLNVRLGKTLSTSDHTVYETELGISQTLARVEDILFEGMSDKDSKKFPARFVSAVPVGIEDY